MTNFKKNIIPSWNVYLKQLLPPPFDSSPVCLVRFAPALRFLSHLGTCLDVISHSLFHIIMNYLISLTPNWTCRTVVCISLCVGWLCKFTGIFHLSSWLLHDQYMEFSQFVKIKGKHWHEPVRGGNSAHSNNTHSIQMHSHIRRALPRFIQSLTQVNLFSNINFDVSMFINYIFRNFFFKISPSSFLWPGMKIFIFFFFIRPFFS